MASQQPTSSFTGEPTGQWEVTPSDFLDGQSGLFYDARPVGYTELDGAEALYTPDDVVIGVGSDSGDVGPSVIGLDPTTGQLRWRFDYQSGSGGATCFSLASKHLIACLVDKELTWIDTRTDTVSAPVPSSADAILDGSGDSIYSVTTHASNADVGDSMALAAVTLERGTRADPSRDWTQNYPISGPLVGYDGGVTGAETASRLSLGLERTHLLINASDGQLIDQQQISDPVSGDPFGLTGATEQDTNPSPDVVSAGGARIALDAGGDQPSALTATTPDGQPLWKRDLPDPYSSPLASDQADGFGRSSVGVAGSSVVFSSQIVLEAWTGFSGVAAATSADAVQYRTPCGREPDVKATSATESDGTIRVTLHFVGVCPGGQWVDGRAVEVGLSSGGAVLGHGTYDFSSSPVWLPDPSTQAGHSGVDVPISLPAGNAFALPSEIQDHVQTIVVACRHSAGSSGEDTSPPAPPSPAADYVPFGTGTGQSTNEDALAALRRIAAADRGDIADSLEGRWVPQLSSKQNGTTDLYENHTYDYADILAEHLRLRLHDPQVRLLFSTDWGSYKLPGYWVSVVAKPSSTPASAIRFCDRQGFPVSHCYAKRILRDGPYDGTTRLRGTGP